MPFKSVSICDGFRKRDFFRMVRGLLPFLAVMLLAAPQLAFAQDSVSVTVNPRSLEFFERAPENTGMYTVQLDADPGLETVTIMIVGGEGVVEIEVPADRTLELTTDNWEDGVDVRVTGVTDEDAVDETVTLTHTAMIGDEEVAVRNVSVAVRVKDRDEQVVTISTDTLAVGEANSGTYTIKLDTQPTAPVTVDIGGVSGEFAVSPSRLVFNPSGAVGLWSTEQTVRVFAGEDFDAEIDRADLTHTVRGGDYTGVGAGTVTVTSTENDMRGVTVGPNTLNIVAGARGSFTVVLDTQPTRTVTITVAEDSNELSVSPSRLNFSTSNWNRPQAVTVRVASDAETGPVILTNEVSDASSSRDMGYDGEDVDVVTVTISERTSDVRLSRSSMTIDEGKPEEYTVRLARDPGVNVERTVAIDVIGDGFSVDDNSNSLTFSGPTTEGGTDGTWNTPRTVMVTGPDDDNAVEETATITHSIGGIVASGILRVTMDESDTRGVTVSTTSLEVTENGNARYNIVLDSEPVGDEQNRVTVTVGGASGDVTVTPSQLVFTHVTWFTAQEVEVSAALDDDGEPDAPVTLTHTVRGGDYERTRADSVRVTVKEIHTRGIIVDTTLDDAATEPPTSSLPVGEGMTGMYSVRLESQPTGTVTVMVRGASGDVTVSPSRLIFTTSNWDEAQMVEVKAGQDDDAEPDPAVTLTHAASGGGYSGVTSGMVTVTVTEDDTDRKGVRISPRALTVTEGAAAGSYAVVLTTEPTGTVTITLGNLAAAKKAQSLEVNPTSLAFNRGNWKIPQVVSVRAAEDDDATGTTVDGINTPVEHA